MELFSFLPQKAFHVKSCSGNLQIELLYEVAIFKKLKNFQNVKKIPDYLRFGFRYNLEHSKPLVCFPMI